VPSASIRAGIPQSGNILLHFPSQVIFNGHGVEMGGKVEDLGLSQFAHFDGVVEMEARHYFGAGCRTNAEKGLEGALESSSTRLRRSVQEPGQQNHIPIQNGARGS
jgi:hypothetical protein